ncbi:N-6 DNA methylase, partial [Enterococcus cecorum]|nr:N-6 DNA methylase [Enterococcus cecorum]
MYSQNENASVVADFQTWKRLNNPIKKGQHSYKIIYQNESGFYQHLSVFDVSQTINPQYELYQWKMNEQRLEMLSMQLFQHPDFSQGVRQYYKMMNTHFDVDVVCGVADYLLSNKLKQNFHSENYEYLHSLIQNVETKDLTDTLNFVFEQNKGIISRVYQIQQELERMKDYEQRIDVFGNHAINSRRSEPDKISNVTKTETARTQEEVPGGIRRNDGFTASDSMGVRTVLRGGRDATLPSEEQYETRRPSIDAERTHASEVHAKAHANRTHGNDDVGGHYRVSDERSGEDERLGRRSETGNRESGDSEIRGGTQSNAELHGELSDSHVGEIDGTRTSESGVHARESDLHTADLSSERNLTDGRRATNRITQEKPIDSESSIIQTVTRTTSNTESIVSNIQADVDQSSTPAFSFTQNQLKEIAIEELQTNQVIVRQEIPYRVGEITDRGSVQIIGLTNLEDGKESKWYYFPAELVPIYVLDESVISEHMQEAAIIADDETFEAVKQTENTNDLSVYENGNFDDLQLEQIKEGLSRGLDVTIFADPKYDAGQMREIALGLEDGLDISAYADTKYNYGQMRHIRMGLKSGLDVSIYADTKFSAPQMGEIKQGLMFDLDVSQYANPSMDYREMNKIREELQQQAYLERANSLSEEAKHDSVEDTLSDLDGYIRLKPTEFYKGLDVVIDDETYQILDFEDHGNGIGTLSVRTSTSTTSFYESLERLEVYAKEEDLQRFAGKEREQEVLESNESVVETEESPISEERQHPTSTEQIELSPEQFYEGMKVTYQSEEYTIQSFENYGNGLGKLSLASDEKNATLFNSLKYMNGVFATNEEVAKFESQYQKDEFDGQTQSPEHSSFSMPLFQYISTTEEKTEVSDDWTLLSEDMRYKEVGENTFLIYPDGRYSENPVDIMTENGQLYYKEREAVSIIEPYEVNLFDFEENTPTNASIDVPIVDQEIVVPPISEKSVGDTKANEADQMQHLSVEKTDFQFTPDKLEGFYGKTPKERIADNLQAIRLLKTIEQEERLATPEEQEILAKYVGWGGLADLVDENKSNYQEERQDLKELLTPAEYASVRESVLTAYYTDPKIIQVIYEAIEKTGFKGGNILDPAMGTGNFFAAMPQEMKANSTLYGVELDSLTARLAKQLHQTAHIQQMGFENTAFNQGSFDLVVGNVPFADFKLRDEQTLNEYYIHDYFVKRSLDLVHSGGIVAVITSSGTMDKQDKSFRTELAKQADLVGMVRLPNTAFKAIAGTEVVTDILFFQKRPLRSLDEIEKNPPLWLESNTDQSWKLVSNPAFPLTMNEYLKENVLARQENSGKKWYLFPEYQTFRGGTYTFRTREGFDYLSNIREELIDEASGILFNGKANQEVLPAIDERIRKDVPLFTYFVSDNTIQYYDGESLESLPLKGVKKERLLGMIALREQVKSIIDYQQEESYKDEVFQAQLQTLNENYDSFIDKYGYLSDKGNSSLFSGDDYASLLLSIENEKDGKISKGDIFYRPTVRKKEVLIVQTPLEALNHSLSKKGRVDIDYMLSIYETTKEQLLKDLDDAIFDLPSGYETKEQYLSGDVKTKLAQAKQWAKENPLYEKHVRALESVQPEDLGVSDIHVELGARWIPEDVYKQFIVEVLEIPEFRFKWEGLAFRYSPASDNYLIGGKMQASNVAIDQTYGTARINALQILEKTLNYRKLKIVDQKNESVDGS